MHSNDDNISKSMSGCRMSQSATNNDPSPLPGSNASCPVITLNLVKVKPDQCVRKEPHYRKTDCLFTSAFLVDRKSIRSVPSRDQWDAVSVLVYFSCQSV